MTTGERHLAAYRNTLLAREDGRYVLGHLLTRLHFFSKCETEAEMALRNIAIELLEDLGILFVENANDECADMSINMFVGAISKLDVTALVDAQINDKKNEELS